VLGGNVKSARKKKREIEAQAESYHEKKKTQIEENRLTRPQSPGKVCVGPPAGGGDGERAVCEDRVQARIVNRKGEKRCLSRGGLWASEPNRGSGLPDGRVFQPNKQKGKDEKPG